jgi:hypothetical protein
MSRNPDDVKAGVAATRERIAAAAARAGRDASEIEIVAAVKYLAAEDLPLLHAAGITRVGENRTDQLVAKQDAYGDLFTWDFIGHLQSRKVREIAGRVNLIHSLFTESTAAQIERRSPAPQDVLIEVNTAGDPDKDGVAPQELDALLELLAPLANVNVTDDEARIRRGCGAVARRVRRAARARRALGGALDGDAPLPGAVDGDEPGFRGGRRRGCDARAGRKRTARAVKSKKADIRPPDLYTDSYVQHLAPHPRLLRPC